MKYFPISNTLFSKNRKHFVENMLDNSIAFFNSNDCYPVSADTTLPFEQHRDLFYLSGINQEETVLLIYKYNDSNYEEVLFLTKPNDLLTHWEGERLNEEKAYSISGITNNLITDDTRELSRSEAKQLFIDDEFNERYNSRWLLCYCAEFYIKPCIWFS
mgnify:CR=1 FL=1